MGAKVHGDQKEIKNACDLVRGEIAVIIRWTNPYYLGKIVQRYDNDLVIIGEDDGWSDFFKSENFRGNSFIVKLLLPGQLIEIT